MAEIKLSPTDASDGSKPVDFEHKRNKANMEPASLAVADMGPIAVRPDTISFAPPFEGIFIRGEANGFRAGVNVSHAGDVNGDGFDDFIVGAPYDDDNGRSSGNAYVIFGAPGSRTVALGNLAPSDGFRIVGDGEGVLAGLASSDAGDVNGDGFDDLILGTRDGPIGGSPRGEAYVIFGKAEGFGTLDLNDFAPSDGFIIEERGLSPFVTLAVSAAGDVNGDGFDDLVVGSENAPPSYSGQTFVIFGKAGGFETIELANLAPADGFTILGVDPGDSAGWSVSDAGDVNGDGFGDIVLGAINAGSGGAAYVIFGKAGEFDTVDLADLAASDGFAINGVDGGDFAGWDVSSAGDMNGDGFSDVIVGARNGGVGSRGAAYVVFGKAGGFGTIDLGNLSAADGFAIDGAGEDNYAGNSVSSAGDFNGDGFADIVIGAPESVGGNVGPGTAYVIFGKANGLGPIDLADLDPADGIVLEGSTRGDELGSSVSGGGDINGDGFDDIILGAPDGDASGANAGETYVIFGQAPTEAVKRIGSAADQAIRGGELDDTLVGKGGDDTLAGGDGIDRLKGGAGADDFLLASAAQGNFDRILDFGGDDRIALDSSVFGLPEGALAPGRFVVGSEAGDASDRLIYDADSGRLFFDADGSGAGQQVQIARLTDMPTLAAGDFIVI